MNSKQAFEHARDVVKGRYQEGERYIARSAKYSYLYAYFILKKGRFELGEKKIFKDEEHSFHYAHKIMRGRLPEDGHNRMIANSLATSVSEWTKKYFLMLRQQEVEREEELSSIIKTLFSS
jgi:hypothetical protein